MEDFGDDVFNLIIQQGKKESEALKTIVEAKKKDEKIESSGKDKQELYMSIPTNVILHIIKNHKIRCPTRNVPIDNPNFKRGTLAMLPADLKIPKELLEVDLPWLVKKVVSGWNSGHLANSPYAVNRLAAYACQVECVPVKKGKDTFAVISKCRYGSVPYLPGTDYVPWANNVFCLNEFGLVKREAPPLLDTAFEQCKCIWPGAAASGILDRCKPLFVTNKIPKPNCIVWLMGKSNRDRITELCKNIKPEAAYKLPDLENGLFGGQAALWSAWFSGFGHDAFGPVTVGRMLVGAGYKAFYGQLNDIPTWAPEPCILKVPNQRESIIKHTYVNYRDTAAWPEDYLAYILTPEELTMCVRTSKLKTLAMPVTAVLSNAPQIEIFARRHAHIAVKVLMSDPPVVVFERADKGLLGLGIKDQIKLLEKGFIYGFLQVFLERVKGIHYYGFQMVPADGYSATKCHVNVSFIGDNPSYTSHAYMSQTDAERKKITPTDRVSDVRVDGKLVYSDVDAGIIPQYPRCSPAKFVLNNEWLNIGDTFDFIEHTYVKTERINPYHWTCGVPARTVADEEEQVYVVLNAEEKKAEPEEGEIPQNPNDAPVAAPIIMEVVRESGPPGIAVEVQHVPGYPPQYRGSPDPVVDGVPFSVLPSVTPYTPSAGTPYTPSDAIIGEFTNVRFVSTGNSPTYVPDDMDVSSSSTN